MKKILKITFLTLLGGLIIMGTLSGCNNYKNKIATIKTNFGDMTFEFYDDIAPKAVENFITHSKDGYYDNLIFHRVIKDFMIQGGDPTGTGMGGESIWGGNFEYEISDEATHDYGALAMAHSPLPDSNGSQFYIVENKEGAHYLDGDYTVFGHLTSGGEVLDKIANQPTDSNDRPLKDVVIKTIEIKDKK